MKYNDPTGNGPELALPLMLIPGVGETALVAGGVALAATAAVLAYNYNHGNMPIPNVFNPEPPDETNMFPNGLSPKTPLWAKAIIGTSIAATIVHSITEQLDEIKQSLGLDNKTPPPPPKQPETKSCPAQPTIQRYDKVQLRSAD